MEESTNLQSANQIQRQRKTCIKCSVCGCRRPAISPSSHFIQAERNEWTAYLPVYLRTCLPVHTLLLQNQNQNENSLLIPEGKLGQFSCCYATFLPTRIIEYKNTANTNIIIIITLIVTYIAIVYSNI